MSARDNILQRVRSALGAPLATQARREADAQSKLSAHPRGPLPTMAWEPLARFKQQCATLASTVDEAPDLNAVPALIAKYIQAHTLPGPICCWAEYSNLPWKQAGLDVRFRPANGEDKVGITGCYCAIAETGTLMSLSGVPTPLTNSLLPDTHIAIVPRARLLMSMEEAWDLLRQEHRGLPRQVSFISGPSRTADIEMTMVLGIHGPYRLHIVVVAH